MFESRKLVCVKLLTSRVLPTRRGPHMQRTPCYKGAPGVLKRRLVHKLSATSSSASPRAGPSSSRAPAQRQLLKAHAELLYAAARRRSSSLAAVAAAAWPCRCAVLTPPGKQHPRPLAASQRLQQRGMPTACRREQARVPPHHRAVAHHLEPVCVGLSQLLRYRQARPKPLPCRSRAAQWRCRCSSRAITRPTAPSRPWRISSTGTMTPHSVDRPLAGSCRGWLVCWGR